MSKYTTIYLALMLVILTGCKQTENRDSQNQEPYCIPEKLKQGLDFEMIKIQPVKQTITLNGTIDYNRDKTIPFHSLVNGIVISTHFYLGDYVQKGQLLAEIKSTEFNELKDELKSLEAELKIANRALESASLMFQDGISSQKELLEAQEQVSVLQEKLNSAKSNLSMFSYSGQSGLFQIKAPQSGYIVTKNIATGMTIVNDEEPLFTIADLENVWVMANVYATSMRYIRQDLDVKVSTLAYPDEFFSGKISKISQVFDTEERVLKAKIEMKNDQMKLRPGMAVDIVLNIESNQGNALAIPNKAIIFDNNQNYIVVFKDDCHQEIRKITPISKNDLYTYASDGVIENDVVITTNELLIYEQLNNRL
jgi:cobalt-zinc-cadmium efflux system membrane fusion protein